MEKPKYIKLFQSYNQTLKKEVSALRTSLNSTLEKARKRQRAASRSPTLKTHVVKTGDMQNKMIFNATKMLNQMSSDKIYYGKRLKTLNVEKLMHLKEKVETYRDTVGKLEDKNKKLTSKGKLHLNKNKVIGVFNETKSRQPNQDRIMHEGISIRTEDLSEANKKIRMDLGRSTERVKRAEERYSELKQQFPPPQQSRSVSPFLDTARKLNKKLKRIKNSERQGMSRLKIQMIDLESQLKKSQRLEARLKQDLKQKQKQMASDNVALSKHQNQFTLRHRTVDLYNKADKTNELWQNYGMSGSFLSDSDAISTTIN